jgi:hypothetical protein
MSGAIQLLLMVIVLINVCTHTQAQVTIDFSQLMFSPNDTAVNFGEESTFD